jgi:hypothetical protein
MQLIKTVTPNVNISAEAQVLLYTYTGSDPVEVIARVDLGDSIKPIIGGGSYVVNFYVNNVLLTPVTVDQVPSGQTRTILVSRPVPLYTSDTVSLTVVGQPADTSVNITASLRTSTPLQITDVYGTGPTAVDQNYGGPNTLAYQTSTGGGIVGATVLAYLTTDYNAGRRGQAYAQGRTVTIAGGAWQEPIYLTPGAGGGGAGNYTLVYYLQNQYGTDTITITV